LLPTPHTPKKYWLVGGFNPSEKYEFVSWGYDIPNMMGKITNLPTPSAEILGKLPNFPNQRSPPQVPKQGHRELPQRCHASDQIMFDASADTNSCN